MSNPIIDGIGLQSKKYIGGNGQVTAAGTVEIDFPSPAVGMIWTGSVAVINGPATAIWTLNINGIPVDILSGAQTAKDIQITHQDILTITGNNLLAQANTAINATFTCVESPASATTLVVPGQDTLFPQTPNGQFIGFLTTTSSTSQTFPVPLGTSFVVAYMTDSVFPISATFTYTLQITAVPNPSYGITFTGGPIFPTNKVFQVPIPIQTNQQILVNLTVGGSSPVGSVWLYAFSTPQIPQNTADQPQWVEVVTQQTAHSAFTTSVPTGGAVTTILAAPNGNNLWEVVCINYTSGGTTANSFVTMAGLTSLAAYWQLDIVTGSAPNFGMPLGAAMYLNEGLTVAQSTGVNALFKVIARQVAPSAAR